MLNIKEDHHLFPRGAYHVILAPRIYYSFLFFLFLYFHKSSKKLKLLICVLRFFGKKNDYSSNFIPKENITLNYLPGWEVNQFCTIPESPKYISSELSYLKWEKYEINKKNITAIYLMLNYFYSKNQNVHKWVWIRIAQFNNENQCLL